MASRPFHRRRTIPPNSHLDGLAGLERSRFVGQALPLAATSVIPSEFEESLTILFQKMIRDVSTSLDMTKEKSLIGMFSLIARQPAPGILGCRACRRRERECFLPRWNASGSKDLGRHFQSEERAVYPFRWDRLLTEAAPRLSLRPALRKWQCVARFLPNRARRLSS